MCLAVLKSPVDLEAFIRSDPPDLTLSLNLTPLVPPVPLLPSIISLNVIIHGPYVAIQHGVHQIFHFE